jgi:hypothetical protein
MAHERTQSPYNQPPIIPEEYNWPSLVEMDGIPLEMHYRHTLESLGKAPGWKSGTMQSGGGGYDGKGNTYDAVCDPVV